MNDLKALKRAIKDLHGLEAVHLRSEKVLETFQGKTVWEGTVEVYQVAGHPKASLCYAWNFPDPVKPKETRYVAVLGVTPIDSPKKAVQAFIGSLQKSWNFITHSNSLI